MTKSNKPKTGLWINNSNGYTSICCDAPPMHGQIEKVPMDGKFVYIGQCSDCKDGSEFEKKK